MRREPLYTLVLLFLWGAYLLRAEPLVGNSDVLAICGDSITQQKHYSVLIEDYLLMCQGARPRQIVEFGWTGEQAAGLLARVDTELYPLHPSVVTTCYGMNDGHYQPLTAATGDAFRQATTRLVESFKQHGVREIVLGGPGCVDSHYFRNFHNDAPFDPSLPAMYNQTLAGLSDIARDVARQEGVPYAELHTLMMQVMAKVKGLHDEKYPFINNGDGVHPGAAGHLVMAYAFLKALGCDGAIGTITLDLAGDSATGSPGQKIISCQAGTVEVESSRYPFCYEGPDAEEVLPFLAFNQDLNRYRLVVNGLTGAGARVTWGNSTKQFSTAELAQGVNLAAEFLDNPFCERFRAVDAAVQRQQEQDRELVQTYFHNASSVSPDVRPAFELASQKGLEWDRALYALSAAMVVPIRHTLQVVAVP